MGKKYDYKEGSIYGCKKLLYTQKVEGQIIATVQCVYCGKISIMRARALFCESTISCRCRTMKALGLNKSRIYKIYHNMLYRCNTSTCNSYQRYGGAGISVSDEWSGAEGFRNFYEWSMANGYTDNMTIDRIDNHGDYCPENCRWVTKSENTTRANKTSQHRKANRGTYFAKDPNGITYVFDNASQFCREHPELNAGRLRHAANHNHHYKKWWIGFLSDSSECICEPQSTIESTHENVETSRVHVLCNEYMEAPGVD